MKKWLIVLVAIVSLAMAVPAFAGNDQTVTTGDINGNKNVALQGKNFNKSTFVNGDYDGGTTYNGNYNGGGNTTDNSIKTVIKDNLNDNQVGLLNQKGQDNQMGLVNQKGSGNNQQTGLLNVNDSFKDNSTNKNNSGIIGNKNHHNVIGGSSEYGEGGDAQQQNQQQQQQQQQQQGQTQGQAIVGSGNSASMGNKTSVNIKNEAKRGLPTGAGGAYSGEYTDYREKAKDTANTAPVEEFLSIKDTWTLRELSVLQGRSGLDYESRVFAYSSLRDALGYPKTGIKGMNMDATIKFVTENPAGKDMALIRIRAEDREVDSVNVLALAAIEALRHGATTLYIAKADFERLMNADAWGIMFGGSGSVIKDGSDSGAGAVIAPGLGYGSSSSGYDGLPYVRAYAFR